MDRGRFRLLVQLFTRRFFENDLLAPDIDLRPSAIWLLPALAAPAFLWTVKRAVPYSLMSVFGYEMVEMASWLDKSLLMALAMAGAGVVTVLVWEALLVDRRDAFVLGSVPIQPRMVVAAKGLAVLKVFAVVAALNLPSVLIFSIEVYGNFSGTLIVRSLLAHTLAATAASLSTSAILALSLVAVTSFLDGRCPASDDGPRAGARRGWADWTRPRDPVGASRRRGGASGRRGSAWTDGGVAARVVRRACIR